MTLKFSVLVVFVVFICGCVSSGPSPGRVSPVWTTVEERELAERRAEKARLSGEDYPFESKLGPVYRGVELVDRIPPVVVTKKSAFHTDVNLVDPSPNVMFVYKVKWGGGRKKEKRSKSAAPSFPDTAGTAGDGTP